MQVWKNNIFIGEYDALSPVEPLDYAGEVIISIDQSKTNFAVDVLSPTEDIVEVIEFSGNNRKRMSPPEDDTRFCREVKHFFIEHFKYAEVIEFGIEAALIKSYKKGKRDYAMFRTTETLQMIRTTCLDMIYELSGTNPTEVNNWAWKSFCLPQGFRGNDKKYSKLYLQTYEPDNPLCAYYDNDATDAFMIGRYIIRTKHKGYTVLCNRPESCSRDVTITIHSAVDETLQTFVYNDIYPIETNLAYYANRSKHFQMEVPLEQLTLEQIYKWNVADDLYYKVAKVTLEVS